MYYWSSLSLVQELQFFFHTSKSLSEALIFASTNPQYDDRLFIELQVQYMEIPSSEHGENMLCTKNVFDIQNNFCTQHFSHVLQKEELLTKIYLHQSQGIEPTKFLGPRCLTTNDSPDKNAECKFPWKFDGKITNECTDAATPDGR